MGEGPASILSDEKHVEGTWEHLAEVNSSRIHDTKIVGRRKRRHKASLLCRCPADILGLIFSIIASSDPDELQPHRSCSSAAQFHGRIVPRIARISHVCQYWRDICLHDPRLWSNIDGSLVGRWPMVFMERSGSAALNVTVVVNRHSSKLLDAIPPAMPRIRVLNIQGHWKALTNFLQHLTLPAAIMESLDVRQPPTYHAITETVPFEERVAIPSNLFSGHAPRLRSLFLFQCGISSLPFPALSDISILEAVDVGSIEDMMQLLSNLPNISRLTFTSDGPIVSVLPPPVHGATIHLPELTAITIEKFPNMGIAATFLMALDAPRLSQLDIAIQVLEQPINEHVGHVLRAISPIYANVTKSVAKWDALTVRVGSSLVSAKLWPDTEGADLCNGPTTGSISPFSIAWRGNFNDAEEQYLLSQTLDVLPSDSVTFLSIPSSWSYPSCLRSLYTLKSVVTLHIDNCPRIITDFLKAATPIHGSILRDTPETLMSEYLFPRLRRLVLVHLQVAGAEFVHAFREFSLARQGNAGTPVEVVFEECDPYTMAWLNCTVLRT